MTSPYTITKSDGSTLTLIYPYETNGPGGSSSPLQVGCGLTLSVINADTTPGMGFIIAGNFAGLFASGFTFYISGGTPYDGTFTVFTSTYNLGLNQTWVYPNQAFVTSGTSGTLSLQVFLLSGDFTAVPTRFTSGFAFQITTNPALILPPTNDGTYNVGTGLSAVYDTVTQFTSVPSQQVIPQYDTNPFLPGQYQLTYTLPASSTLTMVGPESLNWGIKIWENMVHMTENFANTTSPVDPMVGQIWFDTTGPSFQYWTGSVWSDLSTAVGGVDSFNTRTGAVTLTSSDVTTALGYTPAMGTVTSVAASGSTGLTVGGSPITSSGTLTFTLSAELQGLSGLSTIGFVRRTGVGAYSASALTGSEVTTALGYTPANVASVVTSVGSGSGLTGGPITTSGTLSVDSSVVPFLANNNPFTGLNTYSAVQTFNGNIYTPVVNYGTSLVFKYSSTTEAARFDSIGNFIIGDPSHTLSAPFTMIDAVGAIRTRPHLYNAGGVAASVSIDTASSNVFRIYNLGITLALNNPTQGIDGQVITLSIVQGAAGNGIMNTIGTQWKFPGISVGTPPTIAQGANAASTITAVFDGTAGLWRATISNDDGTGVPGFTQSLTQNGWQKLPSGLIIQWGRLPGMGSGGTYSVIFPTVFPHACFTAVISGESSTSGSAQTNGASTYTTAPTTVGFTAVSAQSGVTGYWMAIGW